MLLLILSNVIIFVILNAPRQNIPVSYQNRGQKQQHKTKP